MKVLDLDIIGSIGGSMFGGGVTFDAVRKKISAAGKVDRINVTIHSQGGSVFEGFAIFAELDRHPADICVEIRGLAASIASVIAMAADDGQISIHQMGRMMMHEARGGVFGTADDAKEMAGLLESMDATIRSAYARHGKWDEQKVQARMKATTWLTAAEAKKAGFVSKIVKGSEPVNRLDFSPLAGIGVPDEVRKLYDAAMSGNDGPTLADEVAAYLETHGELAYQPPPGATLRQAVEAAL